MKELTSAFMKKHFRLFNKMIRAETYKNIAKMNAETVREVFKRDFRENVSGKDGKTFYAPRKYEIDLDSNDDFTDELKKLSKDLKKNKPKAEPKKKFKGVSPEPSKKSKEIEKERSRVLDVLNKYPSLKNPPTRGLQSKNELYRFLINDAKTIKSLKEVEKLIERAGKKELKAEPKKAEPKKAEPKKKLLAYEKAWAVGNANDSQKVLISKMTDKRKKEVLKQFKEDVKKIVTK